MKFLRSSFVLALILCHVSIWSQSISVELSATWTKGASIANPDSTICFPKLLITYRNSSDSSCYFQKVSGHTTEYPVFLYSSICGHPNWSLPDDMIAPAKALVDNNKYIVSIGWWGAPPLSTAWEIYNDTTDINQDYVMDMLNDKFAQLHEYICKTRHLECKDDNIYFSQEEIKDIKPNNISEAVRDDFVFLKPNSTYTDAYSLISFQEVGGHFTFRVRPSILSDSVLTISPLDDNNTDWPYIETRMPLPKAIGEYKLYSGSFQTNEISIYFKHE